MVKIFAHRGAKREAPENTLLAFQKALQIGVDGIECDVHWTADGRAVVIHDDDLSLHTPLLGFIHRMSWNRIKGLDLEQGQRIPLLDEVLELASPHSSTEVILDIKEQPGLTPLHLEKLVSLVLGILPREKVLFSAFNFWILRVLGKLQPGLRLAWTTTRFAFTLVPFVIFARYLSLEALHPWQRITSQFLVRRAKNRGWAVHPWVVNEPKDFLKFKAMGVNGVFTDDPRLLKNYA